MMVVCFRTLMTEFHPDEIGMNTPLASPLVAGCVTCF
jgi:hypothetical protein